jgi:SAM-dependent methyltransferase
MGLGKLLAHPLTRGLSVDDPRTTELRHQIIQEKPFLKSIYSEWYQILLDHLKNSNDVLELGSGAGFIKILDSRIITSEIMAVNNIDLVADATKLPLLDSSLDAIIMTDVLHHIPYPGSFFTEAQRVLRKGGKILMIEPWPTRWSEFIYTNLHSEPFDIKGDWTIPATGPLSGANGALPWILFERDRKKFEVEFPECRIRKVELMMPFSYLLSGGVSIRFSMPGFLYKAIRTL